MKVTLFDPDADLIIVAGRIWGPRGAGRRLREDGYLIHVERFACLGFQFSDFQIHAHDLPEGWGIHGLVGLTFLRQFNCELRMPEGWIVVDRAQPQA